MTARIIRDINDVDEKALSMTLDTLVSRHESLRTVFLSRGEMVLQKICSADTFMPALTIHDIRKQENKDEQIKKIIHDLSIYRFDFEKEPSFKCKLIKYGEDKYVFIFVIDHIIYDAHSLQVVEEELLMIYDAYSKGLPNPLEPLKAQLKDFSIFCQRHYEGDRLTYHKTYFRNLNNDLPQRLKIKPNNCAATINFEAKGIDEHNLVLTEDSKGGVYNFSISEDFLRKIHIFSSEMKITFFNFMLATYSIFLSRVTFQKDLIIDSPMSTRRKEEHLRIIGWLTGTLVTRIRVDENASFKDLIKICFNALVEALDHIYYQSSEDVLNLDWFLIATQLNVLNDINTAEDILEDFCPCHVDIDDVSFNLTFLMKAFKNGLLITCTYKKSFIDKRQIADVCGKFLEVLNMAINSPESKIKDWKN